MQDPPARAKNEGVFEGIKRGVKEGNEGEGTFCTKVLASN